ncbi:MAG TPA: hypothetical protein VL354_10120, partial [Spirochaetia bacterium]|nr:hypothetical protein [Spirochaetia bacterium]
NNYVLFNLDPLVEVKRKLEGKVVLFVCDFTPMEYEAYFRQLLETLPPTGMSIDSQYSATVALLKGGRYDAVHRDLESGRGDVFRVLRRLCEKRT